MPIEPKGETLMVFSRRDFVRNGFFLAGSTLLTTGGYVFFTRIARAATSSGGYYTPNLSPLQPYTFYRLPPGSIKAQGWLANQLQLELQGLCGTYPSYSHFLNIQTSGWTVPSQYGFEEVPYWLRGYGDLAYVTGDSNALATTKNWLNGIIATQQSDGFFGPTMLRTHLNNGPDIWPYLPLLRAFCSYQEYSGDSRIVPFLTSFLSYVNAQNSSVFSQSWISYRCADLIETIFWLYNRTGASWLTTLATRIHQNSANFMNNLPGLHNVDLAQGFREPAVYGVLGNSSTYASATYSNYATIMNTYGQFPGGGFAGDEHARVGFGDPRQGFETCGIVEFMQSHEILNRITGDPIWADRVEDLAFNMLPAALDPNGKATHYITCANSIQLDNQAKTQGQFDNGFAMLAYIKGVDQYRCCPHNYGMGWPFFTEETWLATPDNGLCAALYAATTATAKVGDGTAVTFTETTDYPFSDTITFTLSAPKSLAFPLYLRIPGWCANPVLKVNGQSISAPKGPAYATIQRTWNSGDVVALQLPMQTSVKTWSSNANATSVSYGPLSFSLQINENYALINGSSSSSPEYQVTPGSAWNYGLVLNNSNPASSFAVKKASGTVAVNPFTQSTVPVTMAVAAQQIPQWTADDQNVVNLLQNSPVMSSAPSQNVTLIPMGAARLRITMFPTIGGSNSWNFMGARFRIMNKNSGKVLAVQNMLTTNSVQVQQFQDNGTADHLWILIDNGDGSFRILNQNSNKVLGVDGMSTADSANVVQYQDSGTADHLWTIIDNGDGYFKIQNRNSGKLLGVSSMSTADSANVVQFSDNGTSDHLWTFIPDTTVRIQNLNSGKVLGVDGMSTTDSANVVQFQDNGTADHLWTFIVDANGYFRIQNLNSGKVIGVDRMLTTDSAQVVQYQDNGTADHLWCLRYSSGSGAYFKIQNRNSGKVLGVSGMSQNDSALVVQFSDNGTNDHLWRFI
jgi:Beta-L-arabinofuranosidase, GH127/Ricin-type beta-trefoil lectin domain-like